MSQWIILVEHTKDLSQADSPHKIMVVKDYLANPQLFESSRPNIINLTRSYAYQSAGYYASLLAEARGHRVVPAVQTMLELSRKGLYRPALPELEEALNRDARLAPTDMPVPDRLVVIFGEADMPGYTRFARLLFDWYRAPVLEVSLAVTPGWIRIKRLRALPISKLSAAQSGELVVGLERYTARRWHLPKPKRPARWTLAVLHNPRETLPPTSMASIKRLAQVGEKMGVSVEPIQKADLPRLAEFDALFIRETTSISNHTYRFARRAEQEGMPVIDDTVSMIRCTNKVYLKELLEAAKVPIPPSLVLGGAGDLLKAEDKLGYPMVIKIPDGSFSRGVHKVADRPALQTLTKKLFAETDLLLAQAFMPTDYDWRVGVLDGEPLYACQYLMAKNHWQIVNHATGGSPMEGGFRTFAVDQAPKRVIDIAVAAAGRIGHGLYGVDLKENDQGIFVIEINDNPNLDSAVEGAAIKDELWRRLLNWFLKRLEGQR